MNLSETDRRNIGERATRLEARTGVQVVATVVGKCGAYPEIPWKAFALFSGLAFLAAMLWHPDAVLGGLTFLLGGAVAALASIFLPAFARLFLDAARREAETRQYAASFFLGQNLSRTRQRNAILILVGVFERTVVILPDAGLRDRVSDAELQDVIARMTPQLAAGRIAPALRDGLDALEALLAARGFAGGGGADEIAQEVFEEKGE
jgi:uncharacterized membrane protein